MTLVNKLEWCSVCNAEHNMLDGGDIIDCMIYYRFNIEDEETKKKRESKVEVWDQEKQIWKKKIAV